MPVKKKEVPTEQISKPINDKYVLDENAIKLRPGESTIDAAKKIPRPSICRVYEILSRDCESIHRKRIPGIILCPGAACGINKDGHVDHYWSGRDLDFLGFLIGQGDNREVVIQIRGAVILRLPGKTVREGRRYLEKT